LKQCKGAGGFDRIIKSPAYLRGIETYNRDADRQNDALSPAYLRGIETREKEIPIQFADNVSSLPKRN